MHLRMGICRRTGKWILEEKIDPFGYADSVESLENFKKEFLAELNIPKSIGKDKTPNEYFCYASGKKEIDEVECRKLYKALADERLLEWNEETCFSFMYRMCPSYTPKKDTPSPIIWLGTTRELFNLIWEYYEGSTKIWEKTRKFFHDITESHQNQWSKESSNQSICQNAKNIR